MKEGGREDSGRQVALRRSAPSAHARALHQPSVAFAFICQRAHEAEQALSEIPPPVVATHAKAVRATWHVSRVAASP